MILLLGYLVVIFGGAFLAAQIAAGVTLMVTRGGLESVGPAVFIGFAIGTAWLIGSPFVLGFRVVLP